MPSHLDAAVVAGLTDRGGAQLRVRAAPTPLAQTLHGRILATCARVPERTVLGSMTYGELDRHSAELAAGLSGDRVAVLANPGEDAVVALLAVLRSGAAFVPLDPHWPAARIAQVLALAEPAALIVAEGVEGPPTPVPVVWVDAPPRAVSGTPATRTATDLAYVMFTSGMSGAA